MPEGVRITGVREIEAFLRAKSARADLAAVRIVQRAQAVVESNIKGQFTGAHSRHDPTGSRPGEPPEVVTGTLRRSVKSEKVEHTGLFQAKGKVYPTAVYSRIQELGGSAGRGAVLPARPYVAPGEEMSRAEIARIALEEWARV